MYFRRSVTREARVRRKSRRYRWFGWGMLNLARAHSLRRAHPRDPTNAHTSVRVPGVQRTEEASGTEGQTNEEASNAVYSAGHCHRTALLAGCSPPCFFFACVPTCHRFTAVQYEPRGAHANNHSQLAPHTTSGPTRSIKHVNRLGPKCFCSSNDNFIFHSVLTVELVKLKFSARL